MDVINPNPEEASLMKRMIGDRSFALVNLGDRQVLIEIVDFQSAQQLLDALHADPAQVVRTQESLEQAKAGTGTTLADLKKAHLHG
jgi:hypothetical protein